MLSSFQSELLLTFFHFLLIVIVCLVRLHPWFSYGWVSLGVTTTFSRWVVQERSAFRRLNMDIKNKLTCHLLASALFQARSSSEGKAKALLVVWTVVIFRSQTSVYLCLVM